ncbi:MAG: transglutaminase domain-containing protein [Thermodesulfobacteriota bacterium]
MSLFIFFSLTWIFLPRSPAAARTLALAGPSAAGLEVFIENRLFIPPDIHSFRFKAGIPPSFEFRGGFQRVHDFEVEFRPKPDSSFREVDDYGNMFLTAVYRRPSGEITVIRRFKSDNLRRPYGPAKSVSAVVSNPPREARHFLAGTDLIQVGQKPIRDLSRWLVKNIKDKAEAVDMIMNWLADNVEFVPPLEEADALTVLRSRRAGSEGLAHLAAALLRQAGIPTRVVTGLSPGWPRKVPARDRVWVLYPGQGRRVWIEVYLPDLGWVWCDPGASRYWVSPTWLRLGVGLDAAAAAGDGVMTWEGDGRPEATEKIVFRLLNGESVEKVCQEWGRPHNLMLVMPLEEPCPLGPELIAEAAPSATLTPARLSVEEMLTLPRQVVVLGHRHRPPDRGKLVYQKSEPGRGTARLNSILETLLPLTEEESFFQALILDSPFEPSEIELFLGWRGLRAGRLRVEIKADQAGRPGRTTAVTQAVVLRGRDDGSSEGWVTFPLTSSPLLRPGRYWLAPILEEAGALGWSYSPGNAFGPPDDTMSHDNRQDQWLTLNADFHFGLKGFKRTPPGSP